VFAVHDIDIVKTLFVAYLLDPLSVEFKQLICPALPEVLRTLFAKEGCEFRIRHPCATLLVTTCHQGGAGTCPLEPA